MSAAQRPGEEGRLYLQRRGHCCPLPRSSAARGHCCLMLLLRWHEGDATQKGHLRCCCSEAAHGVCCCCCCWRCWRCLSFAGCRRLLPEASTWPGLPQPLLWISAASGAAASAVDGWGWGCADVCTAAVALQCCSGCQGCWWVCECLPHVSPGCYSLWTLWCLILFHAGQPSHSALKLGSSVVGTIAISAQAKQAQPRRSLPASVQRNCLKVQLQLLQRVRKVELQLKGAGHGAGHRGLHNEAQRLLLHSKEDWGRALCQGVEC